MAFTKNTDDLNIIQKLPNEPNDVGGLTAAQLKAKFDEAGGKLKTSLNGLVDELGSTTAAANIGFASSTGVPENNVQDAIENVQSQLQGISQGAVADGSITTEKLADTAVETAKIKDAAVETAKIKDAAVTTGKLAANSITTEKIQDGAITLAKMASETLWVEIPVSGTGAELILEPLDGTGTISDVKAYYCQLLGMVKLSFFFTKTYRYFEAAFGEASKYTPYLYSSNQDSLDYKYAFSMLSGVIGQLPVGVTVVQDGSTKPIVIYGVTEDSGGTVFVSGFYYTEDVPEETEGS